MVMEFGPDQPIMLAVLTETPIMYNQEFRLKKQGLFSLYIPWEYK